MSIFRTFSHLLQLSFAAVLLAPGLGQIQAVHRSQSTAGVSLLIEGGAYSFNFTAAREACLFLNVTMATLAQMERALQHGLETCKFGWVDEGVAIVPRQTADERCGKGKTGVVSWFASTDKKFGVFCFNASDFEEPQTTSPQRFTSFTTRTAPTSTPAPPALLLTTKSPPSRGLITTKSSERTSITSALQVNTRSPTRSSTSCRPVPAHAPTSHSISTEDTFPTLVTLSSYTSDISPTSEPTAEPTMSSERPPLGDVPTALIVLGVIALLLTAAGIVWYKKLNIFCIWSQSLQKDDIETEMWKHTNSEADLHSLHEEEEEEEEERDRKYSSDITLCVNPSMKTDSFE